MKKFMLLFLIAPTLVYGQKYSGIKDYQSIVKKFYQFLYNPDLFKNEYEEFFDSNLNYVDFINLFKKKVCVTTDFKGIKNNHSDQITCFYELTQGLSIKELDSIVDKSTVYEDSDPFEACLEVTFPNRKVVHFSLNQDFPVKIVTIFLNNGDEIFGILLHEEHVKFKRIGIINDPRGFSYVRGKPDNNSKIAGKFLKNELFLYTPIGDSDWWPVYKETEPLKIMGYLPKREILVYKNFPYQLKKKLLKMPQG